MSATTHNPAASSVAALGRVLLGTIFLLSGISKVSAPAGTIGYIASAGLPAPEVAFAIAVFVELAVSTALIVGYRTRIAAVVLALFSLATAFGFHFHLADQNQFIHFFKNIAISGGFLQVAAFGGGGMSLDAWRAKKA